jgi:hypothetical protein
MSVKTIEPRYQPQGLPADRMAIILAFLLQSLTGVTGTFPSLATPSSQPTNQQTQARRLLSYRPFPQQLTRTRVVCGRAQLLGARLYFMAEGILMHACVAHSPRQSAGLPANSKREGAASAPAPRLPNTQLAAGKWRQVWKYLPTISN